MKYIALTVIAVLICTTAIYSRGISLPDAKEKEITATYKGTTDDFQYEFTDEKGVSILFDYIADDVMIDLYDDGNIGLKFKIKWIETEEDEYDYEGEPTGNTVMKKTITELSMI